MSDAQLAVFIILLCVLAIALGVLLFFRAISSHRGPPSFREFLIREYGTEEAERILSSIERRLHQPNA